MEISGETVEAMNKPRDVAEPVPDEGTETYSDFIESQSKPSLSPEMGELVKRLRKSASSSSYLAFYSNTGGQTDMLSGSKFLKLLDALEGKG